MDFNIGDVVIMKKMHPCKNNRFIITRVGMDIKLRCEKCMHEIMLPRNKAEKAIKSVIKIENL